MSDFSDLIEQALQPIHATRARKLAMREELAAHLQSAYEEELRSSNDPIAATDAALRRFGNVVDLQMQLQSSVPALERFVVGCLRKESFMSTWPWIACWFAVMIAMMIIAPSEMRSALAAVAAIGGIGISRLTSDGHKSIMRWLGPRWGWRAFAIAFGPSIILPALAKLKHAMQINQVSPEIIRALIAAMLVGSLVVFIGLASSAHAIASRRRPEPAGQS
jgi:hypothetical protein